MYIYIYFVFLSLSLCTYYVCVIQVLTASNDHPNWIRLAYPASIVYFCNDASPLPLRYLITKGPLACLIGQVVGTWESAIGHVWESQIHHSLKWGNTAPLNEWMGHGGPVGQRITWNHQGVNTAGFLSAVSTAGSGSKRGSGRLPVASASGAGCSNGESWSRNMAQRGVGRL